MRSEESVYDALLTQGRPHLLFLMAHPSANVRRTTYATISRILLVITYHLSLHFMHHVVYLFCSSVDQYFYKRGS